MNISESLTKSWCKNSKKPNTSLRFHNTSVSLIASHEVVPLARSDRSQHLDTKTLNSNVENYLNAMTCPKKFNMKAIIIYAHSVLSHSLFDQSEKAKRNMHWIRKQESFCS